MEILVLEVGEADAGNELYRIAFDGSIADEKGYTSIGGQAEELKLFLKDKFTEGLNFEAALQLAARALEATANQKVRAAHLEVAALERTRQGRKFRRIPQVELRSMLEKSGNGPD